MRNKTLARWIWLVLAGGELAGICWAKPQPETTARLLVSVFNDADLEQGKVRRAEKIAGEVFARAGISVEWLECGRANETSDQRAACSEGNSPSHQHLHILRRSLNLTDSTLGMSFLGPSSTGIQADIFYTGVARLEQGRPTSSAAILGSVMAHELGHLLLGTDSHAACGLMRPVWTADDLAAASKGILIFTEDQSRAMRARLIAGSSAPATVNAAHKVPED